jgi:uncharacterized membrane protein SirB2
MSPIEHVALLVTALASMMLNQALGTDSTASNVLSAVWILAPYLLLTAVLLRERRTSLQAVAIATLLGSVGALTPIVVVRIADSTVAARLVPLTQAGAAALLVPVCQWLTARYSGKS